MINADLYYISMTSEDINPHTMTKILLQVNKRQKRCTAVTVTNRRVGDAEQEHSLKSQVEHSQMQSLHGWVAITY